MFASHSSYARSHSSAAFRQHGSAPMANGNATGAVRARYAQVRSDAVLKPFVRSVVATRRSAARAVDGGMLA